MPRAEGELATRPPAPPGSSASRSTASSPPSLTVWAGRNAKTRCTSPPPHPRLCREWIPPSSSAPPPPAPAPPPRQRAEAARDQVELAQLAEAPALDQRVHAPERGHPVEVLGDHE